MRLYLVKMSSSADDEVFYKVGVTRNSVTERFNFGTTKVVDSNLSMTEKLGKLLDGQRYIPECPYKVENLHSVSYKYEGDALVAEKDLLQALKPHQYFPKLPFSGQSECFAGADLNTLVVEYMNSDCKRRNDSAPNELLYKLNEGSVRESDPIEKHLLVLKKCRDRIA